MKGGYQPLSRLEQDLGELPVHAAASVQTYTARDSREDAHIRALLGRLRASNADRPAVLIGLAEWERQWLTLDGAADASVVRAADELRALAQAGLRHLRALLGLGGAG